MNTIFESVYNDLVNGLFDVNEYLVEGIFGINRYVYFCSDKVIKGNEINRPYCTNNPVKAVRYTIAHLCGGVLKSDSKKGHQQNINENIMEPILISSKKKHVLDNPVTMYYVDGSKFNISDTAKYGGMPRGNNDNVKILKRETKPLKDFISQYRIKIEFIGRSLTESDIKRYVSDVMGVFKRELSKLSKEFNFRGCIAFDLGEYQKEQIDEIVNGLGNQINIASLDLWKYNPQARTTDSEELWTNVDILVKNTNDSLTGKPYKIEYDGDWDDGAFYIVFDKSLVK